MTDPVESLARSVAVQAHTGQVDDLRIVSTKATFYALCPDCGMDVLWPSWCTCSPKRVHHPREFAEEPTDA